MNDVQRFRHYTAGCLLSATANSAIAILSFHLGGGICSLSQQAARELDRPANPELEAMVGFDHAKAKAGAERIQLSA
jgi:hypothetical protein